MNTDLTRSIEQATTIDELVRQFEALLAVDISDTPKGHQRLKANQLAKDILAKYNGDYSNVSPEDHVIQSEFEAVATNPGIGDFDLMIGNPPYGVRDASAMKDKAYKDIKFADQYFVSRSIDKAKAGGLIALVLPTRICDANNLEKWRTQLALKAEFLGAHRLPTGTFSDTGVVTDLVIWRKHSDQAKALIDSADRDTLIESNVLCDVRREVV
ncbi:SAM-dependent DNA methyltransferase [Vibrio alginolyticus]|nr:SAM-dependent DNA methyltransferase [Vibrio alginolyticus]